MANSISLDDLVALNDEIAGLVRTGVPLELGLASWGGDLSGQLGRVVNQLGADVARGQSLPDALAASRSEIPPLYRALVDAGLKSGRLPAALESLGTSARNLQEARGAVTLALVYPLVLLFIGYFLAVLLLTTVVPRLMIPYDGHPPGYLQTMADLGNLAAMTIKVPGTEMGIAALFIPPAIVLALVAAWWLGTRRSAVLGAGAAARWLGWIPVAGRLTRDARTASLAEVFALLVEHDVPLGEAITLAAECTGDRRLARAAEKLASSIAAGAAADADLPDLDGLPPFLAWVAASGGQQQMLTSMARHMADTYRRRVVHEAQWLRSFLPLWLVVIVGTVVVGLYALMFFFPFTQLMEALSGATGQSMRIR